MPEPAPAASERLPHQFGPYTLLKRVGAGGMAEVFRATIGGVDNFKKTVAIKRMLPEWAQREDFAEMFRQEAHVSVQLSHSNIVQVFELGRVDAHFYIAMEFVEGADLKTLLKAAAARRQLLPVDVAAFICQKMCAGLSHAHRAKDGYGKPMGLVHRDVSPANVLLSWTGETKVADFGIVKLGSGSNPTGRELTQTGLIKGKFSYMSPEQTRGDALDARSDVFAVGVTLFEMITGEKPFSGRDSMGVEVCREIQEKPTPPLSSLVPGIPPDVSAVVQKAMAKNPPDRFDDAAQMGRALGTFLARSASTGRLVDEDLIGSLVRDLCGAGSEEESTKAPLNAAPRTPVMTLPTVERASVTVEKPPPEESASVEVIASHSDRTVWVQPTAGAKPATPEAQKPAPRWLAPLYVVGGGLAAVGMVGLGLWLAKPATDPARTATPTSGSTVALASTAVSTSTPATPAATPAPLPTSGSLVISGTPPGARVRIDGTRTARLGEPIADLLFGRHTVVVSAEDYRPKSLSVELSAAAPAATPAVALVRGVGEVRIGHGETNSYRVEMPGVVKPGQELYQRFENIPAGHYRATITRENQRWQFPVTVKDGKITKVLPTEDPAGMGQIKEFLPEN